MTQVVLKLINHIGTSISISLVLSQIGDSIGPLYVSFGNRALYINVLVSFAIQIQLEVVVTAIGLVFSIQALLKRVDFRVEAAQFLNETATITVNAV